MNDSKLELTDSERHDVSNMEYHLTGIHFQRLLDLAAEVCLTKPLPDTEPTEYTLNNKLANGIGTLALRAALEMHLGYESSASSEREATEEDPDLLMITFDSILRDPGRFYDVADPEIIKKAEQFGKAIIEESFTVLGADAMEHVELMKSGDSSVQAEQIKWLMSRIIDIQKDNPGQDKTDKSITYNPIRLSPKFVGTYPNMELTPTCLGASIIMSSFFEKAAVPYMHAGVQIERTRHKLLGAYMALSTVSSMLDQVDSATHSPLLAQLTSEHSERAFNESVKDEGYHAGVYAKLANDEWVQVDPYISEEYETLLPSLSEEIEKIYQTLKEFEGMAPNLELSYQTNLLSFSFGMNEAATEVMKGDGSTDGMREAVDAFMNGEEAVAQRIYEVHVLPRFKKILEEGPENAPMAYHAIEHLYSSVRNAKDSGSHTDVIQEQFYRMFEKYVLWGNSLEETRKRAAVDREFYMNRMKDIVNLPALLCAGLVLEDIKENYLGMDIHEAVEFGLPHARVGFSVLSDFATYCDDTLPPTFWAAHWPSLIPMTETMYREDNDDDQKECLRNLVNWVDQRKLTYTKADTIIYKFLQDSDTEA